jgi:hypothetical protein
LPLTSTVDIDRHANTQNFAVLFDGGTTYRSLRPPPNRYPIDTNVVGFSEELIRDAISMKFAMDKYFY